MSGPASTALPNLSLRTILTTPRVPAVSCASPEASTTHLVTSVAPGRQTPSNANRLPLVPLVCPPACIAPALSTSTYGPALSTAYDAAYVPSPWSSTLPRVGSDPGVCTIKERLAPPALSRLPLESLASTTKRVRSPATQDTEPVPCTLHEGRCTSAATTSTREGDPTTASPLMDATRTWRPTSGQRTRAWKRAPSLARRSGTFAETPLGESMRKHTGSAPETSRPETS
mmetsp:Transcript_11085/g.43161  ORF Transcript_11085/g.43161 Transcript_11085/m.43161 type:complete len:229 (-) Transcript_11085:1985-2671(-)